jgi:signal transduction histidine kinase
MTVSLSLILIFVLITYILVNQNTKRLSSSLNEQSKSFAALATKPIGDTFVLYKDSGRIRITQQVDKFLELDPDVTAIRIISIDGTELFSSLDEETPPLDEKQASSFEPQFVTNSKGYVEKVIQPYFEDSGAHRYSVVYRISTKRVEQNVSEVVRLILYFGIGVLVISIAGTGLMLNSFFIKPLQDVSESANIISSGDFDHKITSKHHDEIGDLAVSMEKMADFLKADIAKLRELDKLKSEFMMITSHNLRTPITIIQGYIDLARDVESSNELKNIINTIQESVVRLHLLAENVLTISTLETGKTAMHKSATPLSGFIDAIGKEFGLMATKKNLRWDFANSLPAEANLNMSSTNMRSALGNLIDNAIKFTKAGGNVSVASKVEGGNFIFKVSDTGVGISREELSKLFTKFHRGTSTMSYDYEGIGIGLYLSKLIVEQHGGRIEVQSELNKGSTFTVFLPFSAQPPSLNK